MNQRQGEFDLRQGVIARLESLRRAGVRQLARPAETAPSKLLSAFRDPGRAPAAEQQAVESAEASAAPDSPAQSAPRPLLQATPERSMPNQPQDADLEVIRREVAACTRCTELAAHRTQTVFGVGNPRARLCFLGEAPGADEDARGEPFVGRAGKLLTDIIEKGMRLTRDDVYILNVLKCRPPGNRNPTPEEAGNCREFLDRQLALIRPEFLCCLGLVAAQNLLDTTESMARLRGNWYEYRGIRVMCTYHPAYLLRNPSAKGKTWEDIQMLMGQMGMPTKPR